MAASKSALLFKRADRLARTEVGMEVLDVQFGEDDNRVRKDHSPENLVLIPRAALNL